MNTRHCAAFVIFLIDTSIWLNLFRDKSDTTKELIWSTIGSNEIALTRFIQMEMLQGANDGREWSLLSDYLEDQLYLETTTKSWSQAARIYYDLRRQGITVRSPINCCIAQIAMDHDAVLLHEDRDFERIADIRPLVQQRPSSGEASA